MSDDTNDGAPTTRRRFVAELLAMGGIMTGLLTVLTDLSLVESVVATLLIAIGMALVWTFLGLPLGADLTTSPALSVALVFVWSVGAVGGVLLAIDYGIGLVEHAGVVAVGGGAYLIGLLLIGLAVGSLPTYRRLTSAFGPDPGDARPGDVALGGHVEPLDSPGDGEAPFDAPFSGNPVVCLEARVTEPSRSTRQGKDLVVEEYQSVPFDLQGVTGRVRVDTTDAELRLDRDMQADVGPQDVPHHVATYLADHGITPRPARTTRTFIEHRLEPGEEATIIGEAHRRDGGLVVTNPIVEDGPLEETITAYRTAILRGVSVGAGLAVVGFGGLVVGF